MAQGSAGLAWRRGGHATSCVVSGIWVVRSSMALLGGVPGRGAGLRFGIGRLLAFDVSAEAEAHGGEHLFAEGVLLPRAETREQRRGEHVRRNRLLDCGLDGPATLARILHETGEAIQLRVLRQRGSPKIEQPGRDDAAAPPNLRYIRHVQRKALILGQIPGVLVAQDVEALA